MENTLLEFESNLYEEILSTHDDKEYPKTQYAYNYNQQHYYPIRLYAFVNVAPCNISQ